VTEQALVRPGWIEVIVGCMFSGKSGEGAKRVIKELLSKIRKPLIFTPIQARRKVTLAETGEEVDTTGKMVSRNGKVFSAIEFDGDHPEQILEIVRQQPDTTTVIIEESHFCSDDLVRVCKVLAEELRLRVIVIGLDQTFRGQGFGPMPALLAEAEMIHKELAVCTECGSQNASKSWLDTRAHDQVEEGERLAGDKQYQAVCRHCFNKLVEEYGLPQ